MAEHARDWAPFVEHLCGELGVDPSAVDVDWLWGLTAEVARNHPRPMAPVSAFILGLAAARASDVDRTQLGDTLLGAVSQEG